MFESSAFLSLKASTTTTTTTTTFAERKQRRRQKIRSSSRNHWGFSHLISMLLLYCCCCCCCIWHLSEWKMMTIKTASAFVLPLPGVTVVHRQQQQQSLLKRSLFSFSSSSSSSLSFKSLTAKTPTTTITKSSSLLPTTMHCYAWQSTKARTFGVRLALGASSSSSSSSSSASEISFASSDSPASAWKKENNNNQNRQQRRDPGDTTTTTNVVNVNVNDLIRLGRDQFQPYFRFPLDDWQLQAGGAIVQGYNVIVDAPTGAGKTVVGEMALLHAYYQNQHQKNQQNPNGAGENTAAAAAAADDTTSTGIYTTPLKALSNQKYLELCQRFGKAAIGLSTGDVSINKGARITVMTTEVYRNMAWRAATSSMTEEPDLLASSSSEPLQTPTTGGTEMMEREIHPATDAAAAAVVVVLDEFHYMGHPGRGGVWEESIITSPATTTQLIGLSATLANGPALAAWMESVTERTTVLVQVPASQRPVPLRYWFATTDGLFPLFRDPDAGPGAPHGLLGYRGDGIPSSSSAGTKNKDKNKIALAKGGFGGAAAPATASTGAPEKLPRGLQVNPVLKAAAEQRLQRVQRNLERQKVQLRIASSSSSSSSGQRGSKQKNDDKSDDDDEELDWKRKPASRLRNLSPREERKEKERLLRNELRRSVPSLHILIQRLEQRDLLPAIVFLFSRAGCDEAARNLYLRMAGPRRNLLHDDHDVYNNNNDLPVRDIMEPNNDHDDDEYTENTKSRRRRPGAPSSNNAPQRPTRQRSISGQKRRSSLVQDQQGRSFRPSSNYASDAVLSSLWENPVRDEDDDGENEMTDNASPLSKDHWEFYAQAGLLHNVTEVRAVASRLAAFNQENPEIAFTDEIMEQYLFGIGSHHAGMLPAHKSFVEMLYKDQLMKVVVATETLAAGINMPARTTVISSMAKRSSGGGGTDGGGMTLLETSNLLQMAGRAGRRGMDTAGTCVLVATPFETHDDAAKILTDPILPITSQFSPSYSLAVNLVARGQGKLDVARQLVRKSFAMWEKQQWENQMAAAVEQYGPAVQEVLQASAQEHFLVTLSQALQQQVEKRSAKFDIARVETLLELLNDKEVLKKTSKAYVGVEKMLELEQTTLQYLEKEYETLQQAKQNGLLGTAATDFSSSSSSSDLLLQGMLVEDEDNLLQQIELQKQRTAQTQKEVQKHPFSALVALANDLMMAEESTSQSKLLWSALRTARRGVMAAAATTTTAPMDDETDDSTASSNTMKSSSSTNGGVVATDSMIMPLSARELSDFAKSAVVVRRKTRKLVKDRPDLAATAKLLEQQADPLEPAASSSPSSSLDDDGTTEDCWEDMLSIIRTLVAYGCLTPQNASWSVLIDAAANDSNDALENQTFVITPAGSNIAMLNYDNTLWSLVAMGGAWDVVGASAKLDQFRQSLEDFDNDDDLNAYDISAKRANDQGTMIDGMSPSQREAQELVNALRSLSAHELAGYVACLVSDSSSRNAGPSVVEAFQRLTLLQQRAIQKSLLVMERLTEVQKQYAVDISTRNCILDISNCEVVTAWAGGCTWTEALQLSGASPGDLARTLSRVLDAVRQLGNLPYTPVRKSDFDGSSPPRGLHPDVRRLCREAARAINRYPVKDPLSLEAMADDMEEDNDADEDTTSDAEGDA